MNSRASFQQIFRSASILGSASVANILVGLVRVKLAALLLGPAGIGLIGLLQNLMTTAATAAGMGVANSAIRQLAQAQNQSGERVAEVRKAIVWGTWGLALAGSGVCWLLRRPLAQHVLHDVRLAPTVGWIAIGVGLIIISKSQGATLLGLRKIGAFAIFAFCGALGGTIMGVLALYYWLESGIGAYVIAAPLMESVAGLVVILALRNKLPRIARVRVWRDWSEMVRLGASLMLAGLAATLAMLIGRSLVARELGIIELGVFSASWTVAVTYLGLILYAAGSDILPRLSAVIHQPAEAREFLNEQVEVMLLLAAPMLLAVEAIAPWLIHILYTREFIEAAPLLRWQVVGDALRIVGWPLSFVALAAGRGRIYFLIEGLYNLAFVLFLLIFLPALGLIATGLGAVVMYAVYLPLVLLFAKRAISFQWQNGMRLKITTLLALLLIACLAGAYSDLLGLLVGGALTIASGTYSVLRLHRLGLFSFLLSRIAHTRGVEGGA